MTELEKMQRAKMYIDKLANGIDPIDDIPVSDDDVINNVRISRCLFYVSDILRQVIENNGVFGKTKKGPFFLSADVINQFVASEIPLSVSEITNCLNSLANLDVCTKLKNSDITNWLVEIGLLEIELTPEGKKTKKPTPQGTELGIGLDARVGMYGQYNIVLYNKEAQQFIVDNIETIVAYHSEKKKAENQGNVWTSDEDEYLTDLFRKNVTVSEIAETLKRTETGIRSRLKRLGIIENRADAK